MKEFEFSIPQKVVYGAGSLSKLSEVVNELGGKKAFIISGPHLYKMGLVSKCAEALEEAGIACGVFADTEANPSTDTVKDATRKFIESGADCIIAFGGGSIRDYVADRKNLSAAENMMLGSLFAGIAFSHARLGNVHAMSHPVSAYYDKSFIYRSYKFP